MGELIAQRIKERSNDGIYQQNSNVPYNAKYAKWKSRYLGSRVPRLPVTLDLKKSGTKLLDSIYGNHVVWSGGVTGWAVLPNKAHTSPTRRNVISLHELRDIHQTRGAGKSRVRRPFWYLTPEEAYAIMVQAIKESM